MPAEPAFDLSAASRAALPIHTPLDFALRTAFSRAMDAPLAPSDRQPSPWLDESRALARLAAPIVVTQLAQMAVGTTDILMLGAYGKDALAAAGLGLSLFWTIWFAGMGPALAVSSVVAHILGARPRDRAGVRAAVRMSMWVVLALSPVLMLCLHASGAILLAIGEPPELAGPAGEFARILSLGLPFTLAFNVLRGFATAVDRPMAPLVVMGLTIAANALLDYALIFGHFGAPRLGLTGAAVASASSLAFSCFAMAAVILGSPALRLYRLSRRFHRPSWPRLAEILRLGVPMSVTLVWEVLFFNAGTLVMGHFGAASLAAHQIALNVASLTFMVPLGIATAATVRVGLAAGGGDYPRVRRAGLSALGMGGLFMAVCGMVLGLWPDWVAGLYVDRAKADNAAVIALAVPFLRYAAAFQLFDALQVTAAHALRGLKDASVPMWLTGITYWLFGFPLAFVLAFWAGWEGRGVWFAFAVSLLLLAALLTGRFAFRSGLVRG